MPKTTLGITGLHEVLGRITGVKNPIGDPLRMKACFLRVSITDPPSLAVLENFIPILLPYKNTELVHTAVIQLNFSRFAVVY